MVFSTKFIQGTRYRQKDYKQLFSEKHLSYAGESNSHFIAMSAKCKSLLIDWIENRMKIK